MFSFIKKIRKKIRNRKFPPEMKHLRSLHPDFELREEENAWAIYWKKKYINHIQPLSVLKNTYHGSCFVFANGPSLSEIDIEKLSGSHCFGVNGAIVKFRDSSVRPQFYTIADPRFLSLHFDLVTEVLESGCHSFFTFNTLSRICEIDASVLVGKSLFLYDMINQYYQQSMLSNEACIEHFKENPLLAFQEPFDNRIGFSQAPDVGVFGGRTITFQALQMAYQMGYKHIFLLGLDLSHSGSRFYESSIGSKKSHSSKLDQDYEPIIKPAFTFASQLIQENKVKIYNLSEHSRLPASIIPKCSLQEALSMKESQD